MKLFSIIILSFIPQILWCQTDSLIIWKRIDCSKNCTRTETVSKTTSSQLVQKEILRQISEGYIEFSIDSVNTVNDSIEIHFHKGDAYKWKKVGFEKNENINSLPELVEETELKIKSLENNGFPFASVHSDLKFNMNELTGKLTIDKGPLILFDSLVILSENPINSTFIQNYLSIRTGELYDESKLKRIAKLIKQCPFLKLDNIPSVIFIERKAKVYLNLSEVKSSRFDGIVGLQTNQDQTTSITGQIQLRLENELNRGEKLQLNWERIQSNTQELQILTRIPYLLKSAVGFDFSAEIFRQDSTINRSELKTGLNYSLNPRNEVFIGYENSNYNTNLFNENGFSNSSSSGYYGGVQHSSLDNAFNPRKGAFSRVELYAGNRDLLNNKKEDSWKAQLHTQFFIPIAKNSAIQLGVNAQTLNSRNLFQNELIQIGGIGSIRGVDNKSINVSSWITSSLEYRFLFEEFSNVFVFAEQNFYEQNTINNYDKNQVSATGLGFSIGTKNGIFTFSYSVSNVAEKKFLLRNAKINFGFISSF